MPNRILKETICTSENLTQLEWGERVFFMHLIVQCDDFGRFDARLPILRASCFPLDLDRVPEALLAQWLQALVDAGLVWLYEVNGKRYLQMTSWAKHQQRRAQHSKYPDPAKQDSACNQVIASAIECAQPPAPAPEESRNRGIENREARNRGVEKEPSAAVRAWLRIASTVGQPQTVNDVVSQRIDAKVRPDDVPRWRQTCEDWAARGYRLKNVDGLLNVFTDGWNGTAGSHSPPKSQMSNTLEYIDQEIARERAKEAAHEPT